VTMPFGYVSPEQSMKDRADYARKGIARGGSVIVLSFDEGVLLVAENRSRALHKISEIYDRIAFAAVGKYNEFENLRVAGIRIADLRGYGYDRRDVTGRSLANAYAQALGSIFTTEPKPYEVELIVAEVGRISDDDQIYRLSYDGSVADERGFAVMGGAAERITEHVEAAYRPALPLSGALRVAVQALAVDASGAAQLQTEQLEVAVLDRTRQRARKFGRVSPARIGDLLTTTAPTAEAAAESEPAVSSDEQGVDALAPLAPPPVTSTEGVASPLDPPVPEPPETPDAT